jgi:hypothetical protein
MLPGATILRMKTSPELINGRLISIHSEVVKGDDLIDPRIGYMDYNDQPRR